MWCVDWGATHIGFASHPPVAHLAHPLPLLQRAHRTLITPRAVDPANNPLFASNPAFAAALAGALDRNGEGALAAGRAKEEDE